MRRILTSVVLLVLLFPTFAQGQSLNEWVGKGKGLLCETTGVGCPESVDTRDLVERNGVYFKKRTDVPFTGKTTGDEQGSFNDGKRVGPYVRYYDNGQLHRKGTYKKGKREGLWVQYHDNGQLWSKETYKDDKNDGPYISYWTNGRLRKKGTFRNGEWDGPLIELWDNGKLMTKGTYKNGTKEGAWIQIWDDGVVDYKGTYKDGKKEGAWIVRNFLSRSINPEKTGTYKNDVKVSD